MELSYITNKDQSVIVTIISDPRGKGWYTIKILDKLTARIIERVERLDNVQQLIQSHHLYIERAKEHEIEALLPRLSLLYSMWLPSTSDDYFFVYDNKLCKLTKLLSSYDAPLAISFLCLYGTQLTDYHWVSLTNKQCIRPVVDDQYLADKCIINLLA